MPVGLPRSQTTIFPVTFAGSRTATPPFPAFETHWRSLSGSAPGRPASFARTSGVSAGTPCTIEVPANVRPSPSVTVLWNEVCVLAATVVIQGLG